jgi:type II secretion system protein N
LLGLLFGTERINFGAEAVGGELDGELSSSEDERSVSLSIQQVDVMGLPLLADAVGLPMTGALTGTVELVMAEQKASNAEGRIEFGIDALTVGNGKAKILKAIALPKVNVGRLVFEADAKRGILKIVKLTAKGKDLELSADGKIQLRDPIESSIMDVSLKFRFSDAYKNKNDMTRGLFGDPDADTPGVLELDPKVRRSKRPDGFYAWVGRGPLAKPTFRPGTGSSGSSRRRTTTRRR